MADIGSLPNPGDKPWNLNPAITAMNNELNGRLGSTQLSTDYARNMKWAVATDPQWGIKGDGVTDDTAAINNMFQSVYSRNGFSGGTCYFPEGTYIVDGVYLRSRVIVRGAGKRATVFKAKTAGVSESAFLLRPGPVQASFLFDLSIEGNGVSGQNGIHLVATAGSGGNGGWWESGMRNVRVNGFSGHQIWLEGGVGGLLPHQFLHLDHVEAFSIGGLRSLNVTGQVGQVTYTVCQFDGDGVSATDTDNGASVFIGGASYAHTFIGTTFQENLYGVIVDGASPVTLEGCYWENIGRAVLARNGARLVTVNSPNFSNAARVSDGSGYLYSATGASFIMPYNTKAGGVVDKVQSSDSSSSVMGTAYLGPTQPSAGSTGVTKNIAQSNGTITIGTVTNTYLVNTSATTITTISGTFRHPGESIYLKAHTGSIVLGMTGNISIGKTSGTLTVPQDAWVHLVRTDSGSNGWAVVGMSPA